ncbi:5-oxoprolinase subunit PxpB [Chitinilyticum litopenaei]|uniref:5-oxoprolinase subunit PxpB n=2 Tax=Chitinilyticum piscinae TaxID=2866724 RepID=A0A8J7G1Q8_9NEIS|nr:5-oxoprolinase subunit PxpB [Chitinilyticum piscinae]
MRQLRVPEGLASQQRLWQLAQRLQNPRWQLVLGVYHLAIRFDPLRDSGDAVAGMLLEAWEVSTPAELSSLRRHAIPVSYGGAAGPDLAELAQATGLSQAEVIERHAAPEYRVYCLGFLPGFAYLGGLDPQLTCARRATPRQVVPAGSVGIGGAQTGIYPQAAPGGWQLIGRTVVPLFDPQATPAARLQPGDIVQFVPTVSHG